jgi:hypothetical protein
MRKSDRFEDALYWYDKCLAANPDDANCHASIGFTFHLMQRWRALLYYDDANII